jgi:hypothetical protein
MNKRSAMLIAAGLVLTLGIGGLAVSFGLTGPAPAGAAETAHAQRVVKVQRQTVTAHGTADAVPGAAAQISLSSPGTVDSDDAGEEQNGEEGQEHEGEDHGKFEVEDD